MCYHRKPVANVKGPVPPGPRMPAAPTSASGPKSTSGRGRGPSAKATGRAPRGRLGHAARDAGQLVSDEELEAAAGYGRAHAAELEEEGRRHASGDFDPERQRKADEDEEGRKVRDFPFEDERKRRDRRQRDDDEDTEDAEAANEAAKAAKQRGLVSEDGAGRYFRDLPLDRLGDPTLRDPQQMRRLLGPSVRFAQHAMLLAEAALREGTERRQVLALLADLYVGLGDREYANKALRDFGPATGIVDIYPLELFDHLLEFVPGFCHRVRRGSFLTCTAADGYRAAAGQRIRLSYDPLLRIRGFALKGGGRPGYLLEPVAPPGHYDLTFLSPGTFTVMMSAISKGGELLIETFECRIEPGDADAADLPGLVRALEHDGRASQVSETASPERKKEDLTIHFPRRI